MSKEKAAEQEACYKTLKVDDIEISKNNPRTINEKSDTFKELAESVRASGVIVPIHVRRHPKDAKGFELLAGERSLRACSVTGRDIIPALDHGTISDEKSFEITFAENFCREDMTVMEQGKAVQILLQKYL